MIASNSLVHEELRNLITKKNIEKINFVIIVEHEKNIHPNYHKIKVVLTDGTEFETMSTWGKENDTLKLDIDPKSHFAWTGGSQKILDKGRVCR